PNIGTRPCEPHHPNCRYGWSIHWLTYSFPKHYAPNQRMAWWKLISEANVCRVLNASEGTFAFADNHSLSGMDLRYSLKKYLAPIVVRGVQVGVIHLPRWETAQIFLAVPFHFPCPVKGQFAGVFGVHPGHPQADATGHFLNPALDRLFAPVTSSPQLIEGHPDVGWQL